MDSNYNSVAKESDKKITFQQRSLTPAVLGIPSVSHGAKLPPNMNSKDRTKLLMDLEAWRQARKEKLTASVLARGKQCNSKLSTNLTKPKVKMAPVSASGMDGNQCHSEGRKTVFERLYEDANKHTTTKQPEESRNQKLNAKKPQNCKSLTNQQKDKKIKVPVIVANGSDIFLKKDNLPDYVVEDEAEHEAVNSKSEIEKISQELNLINEDVVYREPKPVLHITSEITDKLNSEEETDIHATNDVNILNDKKDSLEKHPRQFEVNSVCEFTKNVVAKEEKTFKNVPNNIPKKNIKHMKKAPLRRSISLMFRKKAGNCESAIHRTQSECNLKELMKDEKKEVEIISEVEDNDFNDGGVENNNACLSVKRKKTVSFLSPRQNELSAFHLRNKLESWLAENGHSINMYRHLRCFGLVAEGAPCTPHRRQQKIDDSGNASFYSTAPNTPTVEMLNESDKENIMPPDPISVGHRVDPKDVEGWLSDLHRLIVHVKYPGDRCEEWLNAISKKFPNCAQLPIYWECVVAMNENPDAASEAETEEDKTCENDEVEESLAELFDKLVVDEKCKSASKTERGLSVKNIFRSKTVKFALKEKAIKQLDPALGKEAHQKVFVATPVRRSARLQAPDKSNVIVSLKSLDPELRRSVSFKPNEALFMG